MDDFFVKRTFNTPEIELRPSEGILKIEGRSIPEDPETGGLLPESSESHTYRYQAGIYQ
jgi:hypothetical protein